MASTMNILVTFGTENRVVTLLHGQNCEVVSKVRNLFNIPIEYEIKLKRFCLEWGEWLTIEPGDINNRDKIRVETSMLVDINIPGTSGISEASLFNDASPFGETLDDGSVDSEPTIFSLSNVSENQAFSEQSSNDESVPPVPSDNKTDDSAHPNGASNATKRVNCGFKFKPWPANVKIPKENMSPQLRHTLQNGVFPSNKLRIHLIQVLFDYMWQFGSHPSRLHYEQVAQLLVKEFPCLAQTKIPAAKPYDYWKLKLSDKFRNERKSIGTSRSSEDIRQPKRVKHSPSNSGEDSLSISAHIRWMQEESNKRSPDHGRVKQLMEITFQERREDITKNMMVADIKTKYPFLFTVTEIHKEFTRITGIDHAVETMSSNMKPLREGILNFPIKCQVASNFKKTLTQKIENSVSMEKAEGNSRHNHSALFREY